MGRIRYSISQAQAALAVAEQLNFRRAADTLRKTQPAITKSIQVLETLLGFSLFERDRKGTHVLTEAGQAFLEEVGLGLIHFERAGQRGQAAASGIARLLNIGRSPYTDPYITSVLSIIRVPLFPSLRVEMFSNFSAELSRQVLTNELDLAVITEGVPNPLLSHTPVSTAPFYAVFSEDDALA